MPPKTQPTRRFSAAHMQKSARRLMRWMIRTKPRFGATRPKSKPPNFRQAKVSTRSIKPFDSSPVYQRHAQDEADDRRDVEKSPKHGVSLANSRRQPEMGRRR